MTISTTAAVTPRLLAPVRLPERLDGQRLEHLSASSLGRFWGCPESFRAHYLARVRGPESADLRRGWAVDTAIDAHYRAILDTGQPLPRPDVEDIYTAAWQRRLDDPAVAIDWGDERPDDVRHAGLVALRAYLDELAPNVRPISVQREFTFGLAPELEWTLTGRLDVEDADGSVIDVKVKKPPRRPGRRRHGPAAQPVPARPRARRGPRATVPLPLAQPGRQGQGQGRGHAPHTRSAA